MKQQGELARMRELVAVRSPAETFLGMRVQERGKAGLEFSDPDSHAPAPHQKERALPARGSTLFAQRVPDNVRFSPMSFAATMDYPNSQRDGS
jgi:hypothetical protein